MNPRFPAWYLSLGIEVQDDFLRKRWLAVEEFGATVTQAQVFELVRHFHGMAAADRAFASMFESIIQKHDAAFTAERQMELRLLAGAALTHVLEKSPGIADGAALAVMAYNCRGVGSSGVVPEIVDIHRKYLTARSGQLRPRHTPVTLAPINIDEGLAKAEAAGAIPESAKELSGAVKPLVERLNQLCATVTALDEQQQLFREESDVLWWVTGGYSRDLHVPFARLAHPAACIVAGKELADLAVHPVGPYAAPAFLARILHDVDPKFDGTVTLSDAINATDPEWAHQWNDKSFTFRVEDFCPVTIALRESNKLGKETWAQVYQKNSPVSAHFTLSPVELACQMYEESLLIKAAEHCRGSA